jgi:hypothetical protein
LMPSTCGDSFAFRLEVPGRRYYNEWTIREGPMSRGQAKAARSSDQRK